MTAGQEAAGGGSGGATPTANGSAGGDYSDGAAGGGGGGAGRVRLNSAGSAALAIETGAIISPTTTSGSCAGACSTGLVTRP